MFSFAVPDPLMPDPSKQPKNQLNPIGSLQVSCTVFLYLAFCLLKTDVINWSNEGLRQGVNILKIRWYNILFSKLWSLDSTALTWNYFPFYLCFGFSSMYSLCLWFVEFSLEINRTSVHMGRVFYTLRTFLAILVTNLFLFLLRQKTLKNPNRVSWFKNRGEICLFAYSTKVYLYSALSFCMQSIRLAEYPCALLDDSPPRYPPWSSQSLGFFPALGIIL